MKRFSMIIGLIFFIGVFATGCCDKCKQSSEPVVKDAAKTEMEEPAEATAQDVKEAAETVAEEQAE